MKFELRHYDDVLIKFNYENLSLSGERLEILYVNENKKNLLPIGLELNEKSIISWLKSRVIPKNREFVDTVLSRIGLSTNDTISIIRVCKGLSLNDSYWVVEDGFDGKFSDYNLYENRFTRELSLIAYTGQGTIRAKCFSSSPEFTTQGMLRKCWRRENGNIYLYKGGTIGAANCGNEPYSEFYACQIANQMGINHIDYNLKKWKGVLSSVCELFTDINTAYVPIWRFVDKSSLVDIAKILIEYGQEVYDEFVDMLIFDALICNTDRHTGNFGLLVDSKTNKVLGFAPVFDNGQSLFNYAMDDDLVNIDKYANTRTPALGGTFDEIVREFITDRQKAKLRHMINFKFKKHSRYNLPAKRLAIIEKFLQKKVREFLEY